MPNLRIVFDNAAKRATLAASSTAGTLVANNLKNDRKSSAYRSVGKSATLTATFASLELVTCVALPFCNLTATSTIRVRGYTNIADPSPVFDTGVKLAAPYAPFGTFAWGATPIGVNAFSYLGGSYASVWFPVTGVRKLVVDLVDNDNVSSYLEAAVLVIGNHWSPALNADYGAGVAIQERSKHERSASGDLRTERGTKSRKETLDLKYMSPTDRSSLWSILCNNGMTSSMFISLMPEISGTDPIGEQMFQIHGRLTQQSKITMQSFQTYSAPIEIEEV